jgi:hypothetical protein
MHQRTGKQGQPNEEAQHVRPMLREQQRSADGKKTDEDERRSGLDRPVSLRALFASRLILHRHGAPPRQYKIPTPFATGNFDANQRIRRSVADP